MKESYRVEKFPSLHDNFHECWSFFEQYSKIFYKSQYVIWEVPQ